MKTNKPLPQEGDYRKVIVRAAVSENSRTGYTSLYFKSRNAVIWVKSAEVIGYEAKFCSN